MSLTNNEPAQPVGVTFSFGRNWRSFSRFVSEQKIEEAQRDIVEWLGADCVIGKTVLDIGCGSGIHSLGFHRLGAKALVSIDVDRHSVACTRGFWEKLHRPANWRVDEISVLDCDRMADLGEFDLVYSWGVLHHTGQLWRAMDVASSRGKNRGARLWISIYAKGASYPNHLRLKERFNALPWFLKQAYVWRFLFRRWRDEGRHNRRLRDWFWHGRGMNAYHDALDWFGGLPYEVASAEEVTAFLVERGWSVERIYERGEGGCSVYLFRR